MKIKLEITASPELLEAIKTIFGAIGRKEVSKQDIALTSAKRQIKASSEKNTTKEEITPAAEQAPEETIEETVSDEPISIETVRAAVQTKAQSGKRDQVKSLLTKFDVARVTDLPEAKYAKFYEEVNAL